MEALFEQALGLGTGESAVEDEQWARLEMQVKEHI